MKEMLLVLLVWFLGLQEVFGSTIHRFIVPSRVFSERSETSSPDLVTFAAKELRRFHNFFFLLDLFLKKNY